MQTSMMATSEIFLIAMLIIFTIPYLVWRIGKTDYYAPLVVVQIIAGILLGPGVLGAAFPEYYHFIFKADPNVMPTLNGIAQWAVMVFVMIAGVELDLKKAWQHRSEGALTAGLALGLPLVFGSIAAIGLLLLPGWIGPQARTWQFVVGVGMACAVTALPILILLMEKLEMLRQPLGQRILRYASLDDIAIWGVLATILMAWLQERDRWYVSLIWLAACGFAADWSGLHFMVGAFLAGAVMDGDWFEQEKMDLMRHHVLLVMMPVFFLSTGLRTTWDVGGLTVFLVAAVLLLASVSGKLIGIHIAGKILKWEKGEASIIGWLLQTKALIMIIFVNILLDKQIITNATFTALLLMAVASTMLSVPMVHPRLKRFRSVIFKND